MYPYKHILLATDLGQFSEQLAKQSKQIANAYHAHLTLVHTIEPIVAYGYPGFEDLQRPLIEHVRGQMGKLAGSLGIDTKDALIEFGSVKIEILKVAKRLNVDLIIIGSHGRHGISRLLGSGANAINQNAQCDVLTIRLGLLAEK